MKIKYYRFNFYSRLKSATCCHRWSASVFHKTYKFATWTKGLCVHFGPQPPVNCCRISAEGCFVKRACMLHESADLHRTKLFNARCMVWQFLAELWLCF